MLLHGDPSTVDRWRWLRRHLRPGPVRTLDAGCGGGMMALYASRIGNHVLGIDYSADNIGRAIARAQVLRLPARFQQRDLRTDLSDLGRFDQAICCETLEHILDDRRVLRMLSALLVPGGSLMMTTPYKHYRHLFGDRLTKEEDGGHVRWGYTHEEISALFDEVGLDLTVAEYLSGFVVQRVIDLQWRLSRISGVGAWALTLPMRLLQIVDRPVTRMFSYPYYCIAVVGTRRAA